MRVVYDLAKILTGLTSQTSSEINVENNNPVKIPVVPVLKFHFK